MAALFDTRLLSVINPDSSIEAGALLWWYASGTTTPVNTYTTNALSVANSNPVEADANGRFPAIWLGPASYKYILTAAGGNPADPIISQDPYIVSDVAPSFDASLADFLAGDEPLPIASGGTGPSLTLPIANGGTNATTAGSARSALGLTPADTATITTGTDDVEYISSLSLASIRASGAELTAGTDVAKYATPAGLHATTRAASPTASSWYFWHAEGFLEQGGTATSGNDGWSANIDFPIPFPTACFNIQATSNELHNVAEDGNAISAKIISNSAFQIGSDDTARLCFWRAIGN